MALAFIVPGTKASLTLRIGFGPQIVTNCPNIMQSFAKIHIKCKHALPEQMIIYKHAILLHKLYNTASPETEWIALNFQQILTTRQTKFSVIKTNNKRIGNNILIKPTSCLKQ